MTHNADLPAQPSGRRLTTIGILALLVLAPLGAMLAIADGGSSGRVDPHAGLQTIDFDGTSGATLTDVHEDSSGLSLDSQIGTFWMAQAESAIQRNAHAAAWDPVREVFITATGHDENFGHITGVWSFDPSTGDWVQKANLPIGGRMLSELAYSPATDRMYLFAGFDGGAFTYDDVWRYNPATDQWSQMANPTPEPMFGVKAFWDAPNGQFLVFDGCNNKLWGYDPVADSWTPLASPPDNRDCDDPAIFHGVAGPLAESAFDYGTRTLVAFGGYEAGGAGSLDATWVYDAAADNWTYGATLPDYRIDGAAYYDPRDGDIYAYFGYIDPAGGPPPLPAVYDIGQDSWTELADPGWAARWWPVMLFDTTNDHPILFGGWGAVDSALADYWYELVDPFLATGTATVGATLPADLVQLQDVSWDADIIAPATLTVDLRSSPEGTTWSSWQALTSGQALTTEVTDTHLQLRMTFGSDGVHSAQVHSIDLNFTVDQAPTIDLGDDISGGHKGEAIPLTPSAIADPDNDVLTIMWAITSGPSSASTQLSEATGDETEFTADKSGTYTISATATDPLGLSASDSIDVEIVNRAPSVTATATGSTPTGPMYKGNEVTLTAVGTDEDTVDDLSYAWTQGEGPTVVLTGQTTAMAKFLPTEVGTYTFGVTASDGEETSPVATVSAMVVSHLPTAELVVDQSAPLVGQDVQFDASGSEDADGDVVAYRFTFGDGEVADWDSMDIVTHAYASAGSFDATVEVRDADGNVSLPSTAVTIEVEQPNRAPDVTAISVDPAMGNTTVTYTFGVTVVDLDGDVLTYSWDFGDRKVSVDPAPSHTYTKADTYDVKVTVSDGLLTDTATIALEVAPAELPNALPELMLVITPSSARTGERVTVDLSGSTDSDGTLAAFYVDFGDGTPGAWGSAKSLEHVYLRKGTYQIKANVRDDRGGESGLGTREITVREASSNNGGVSSSLPLIGLLLLVVVIAVVVVAMMVLKGRKPPMQAVPPPPPAAYSAPYGQSGYGQPPYQPQGYQPPQYQQPPYQNPPQGGAF